MRNSKIAADTNVNSDLLITNLKKSFENSHPVADAKPLKLAGFPYKSFKNRQKWNFTKSKIGADWKVSFNLLITNVKKSFENSHPVADTEPLKLVRFPHKPSKNHEKWNFMKSKIAADRKVLLEALIMNPKNPIHQKMQKRCFFLPKNSKKHASFTKKGERNAPFAKKKKHKETFLYPKKAKNDVPFNKKMQKRVFLWPKKCKKDVSFYQIMPKRRSF